MDWCGSVPAIALKKRDAEHFAQAQGEIEEIKKRFDRGEIELAYVDEAGFAQVQPNRSAWTPRGEQHQIEAKRGKRLNVVGALLASGQFHAACLWERIDAISFIIFLNWLKQKVAKPLVAILDNASIHTANIVKDYAKHIWKDDITLYFLPAYSPELNRIEKLWHTIKHYWMPFQTRDEATLENDVQAIIDGFGTSFHFSTFPNINENREDRFSTVNCDK